ncbi:MAG: LysR family transcriptional regulator [Burkholderiales bacterium]|nr:LysR family transcriptional regulator [Burkholderiales bacterium]
MSERPTDRRLALTPEALQMMDTIARTGSFAAAARELGKVPSALTYNVRQLEEALDALLFDRSSRQAQLTAAGEELLREGRRLLQQIDAVANRVQRVATGWETQLGIAVDNIIAPAAIFDLIGAFYELRLPAPSRTEGATAATQSTESTAPPTRLSLRSEVLAGTWEALVTGQVDLAIGVMAPANPVDDIVCAPLGEMEMLLAVAPHHPLANEPEPIPSTVLARHRVVAIADTAQRMQARTYGVLAGQDVLTVPSLVAKLEAQIRGLGMGRLPEPLLRRQVEAGRLVVKRSEEAPSQIVLHYAWRRTAAHGKALAWWLDQLASPTTRRALLEQHAGLIF